MLLHKFLLSNPCVGEAAASGLLLPALNRPVENLLLAEVRGCCIKRRLPFCLCAHFWTHLGRECRGKGSTPTRVWPPLQLPLRPSSPRVSPCRVQQRHFAVETTGAPLEETNAASRGPQATRENTRRDTQKRQIRTRKGGRGPRAATDPQQLQPASSTCGFSYSNFVRKCSEWLTERQLERVAVRLKAYKGLKKTPRPQNKLAVVRDIGKIVPSMFMASM